MPMLRGRLDRPDVVLLGAAMGAVATVGWLGWLADERVLVLAVAVGLQLALGGFGAVAVLGPARAGLGLARYVTVPLAGVGLILFGLILPSGVPLIDAPLAIFVLWTPLAALAMWSLVQVELRQPDDPLAAIGLDLSLVAILFAVTVGLYHLFGEDAWPSPLAILWPVAFLLALRAGEARGWGAARAIGRAALHALAVVQIAAAAILLALPGAVGPALAALAFYAWGGAADALEAGRPRRELLEFVALGLLGVLVALLLDIG